jgi:hypothetical protein
MLQKSALFLPKASLLGDPFEGSTPKMNRLFWRSVLDARKATPDSPALAPFKDMTDAQITATMEQSSRHRREMAESFLVNSWHMSEHESAAMWKVYTVADEAICIQSTFTKLRDLMPCWVHIGAVDYIDYDTATVREGNVFNFITIKRHSFDYERELRAVIWGLEWQVAHTSLRDEITETGMWVSVNLAELIEAIYISPTSPTWFAQCVAALVEKYGLTIPVRQSILSGSPIY